MTERKQNWGRAPWKISFRSESKALPEHVDFAIVGGGFTGLSAAVWLARLLPRKSVLLLEAESVGNGASGRTGGMVLAETAAGNLPKLGNVLRGYRRILRELEIDADLELPGAWEVARGEKSMEGQRIRPLKGSPIDWNDSGRVRAVGRFPGGTVDPGKVVSGLAQAAVKLGAQISEWTKVVKMEFSDPTRLHVEQRVRGRVERKIVTAERVLLATNAGSRELAGKIYEARESAEPRLTFAIATGPLSKKQIKALGMDSARPFYTVDIPYLWGRRWKNGRLIFGSGLVPAFGEPLDGKRRGSGDSTVKRLWDGLENLDIRKGKVAERLRSLEQRVRQLHPALAKVRITHRWGGPIMTTKEFLPVFRRHTESEHVIVLGGYSGHGVALSVYLGYRAAQFFAGRYTLPNWHSR